MISGRLIGRQDADPQKFVDALGGLKGPLMKAAQFLATIPEALTQRLHARRLPRCKARRRRWVRASSTADGRPTGAGLAGPLSRNFDLQAGLRRLDRPGPSRHHAPTASRSPASCNIPTWPRRWRPISPSSTWLLSLQRRIERRGRRRATHRRLSPPARGAGLPPRSKNAALYSLMLGVAATTLSRSRGSQALSTGLLLTLAWMEGEKLL